MFADPTPQPTRQPRDVIKYQARVFTAAIRKYSSTMARSGGVIGVQLEANGASLSQRSDN